MEQLTIKELACYLPYGLIFYEKEYNCLHDIVGIIEDEIWCKDDIGDAYSFFISEISIQGIKPILFPIEMINQEIEIGGKKFIPIIELFSRCSNQIF